MQAILQYLDNYTPQILVFEVALLAFVFATIVAIWLMNKKRYTNLKHQVPATVVNDYLNSIIQNSNALKSSLFRGGGIDGIPSVMPVAGIPADGSIMIAGDVTAEELSKKNAEISSLQSQLASKTQTVFELEQKLKDVEAKLAAGVPGAPAPAVDVSQYETKISALEKKIKDLEAALAAGGGAAPAGDDSELRRQLEAVTKERDELKERLQEYGIIEDDLANLKRLQQENEQLRKSLESMGGNVDEVLASVPAASAAPAAEAAAATIEDVTLAEEEAAPEAEEEAAPEAEEALLMAEETPEAPEGGPAIGAAPDEEEDATITAESSSDVEAELANLDDQSEDSAKEKSPEDLLSEFEKMLG